MRLTLTLMLLPLLVSATTILTKVGVNVQRKAKCAGFDIYRLIILMQPVNNGIIECTPEGKEIKQKAGKNDGKHL